MGDMEEFTRSRSDIVKFTKEEGHLGCLLEIESLRQSRDMVLNQMHFPEQIDCMFRVDDRMSCIDYPERNQMNNVSPRIVPGNQRTSN